MVQADPQSTTTFNNNKKKNVLQLLHKNKTFKCSNLKLIILAPAAKFAPTEFKIAVLLATLFFKE